MAQNKAMTASPTHRQFTAVSQGTAHLAQSVVAAPLVAPGSQLVRPVPAAASLAVSVIKSAPVEPTKQMESSEMEKNGLSQSSEDESPIQSPKAETKVPISTVKPREPTSIAGSVGELIQLTHCFLARNFKYSVTQKCHCHHRHHLHLRLLFSLSSVFS